MRDASMDFFNPLNMKVEIFGEGLQVFLTVDTAD